MANNNHFELTLDTLAPTGSITRPAEYLKENTTLNINAGDAAYKKVWFDTKAAGDTSSTNYQNAKWDVASNAVTTQFTTTGTYYYHMILKDSVENESKIFSTTVINYDCDKPVVSEVYLQDSDGSRDVTNETTLTFGFKLSDVGTGIYKAVISGDVEEDYIDLGNAANSYTGTVTLKSTNGKIEDGYKTIKVVVYDRAENASTEVTSNSILLDRELDKPTLLLQNSAGANLPAYINYNTITVKLTSAETNIASYKIWEGNTEPETWQVNNNVGNAFTYTNTAFSLSAGDGQKTIHAKVKDAAGNITEADVKTVTIDTVDPSAKLTIDKTIISKVKDFDKATINIEASDDRSGITSYSLVRITSNGEETVVASGTTNPNGIAHEVTVDTLADGEYKYQLTVVDKAGNTKSSNQVSITFDTQAPTLSINLLKTWQTRPFDTTITYSDPSGCNYLTAWISTVENDTNDSGVTSHAATSTITSTMVNVDWDSLRQTKSNEFNYYHVKLVDNVGNIAYAHAPFQYDTIKPVITNFAFNKTAYATQEAQLNLTFVEEGSQGTQMRIWGTGVAAQDWQKVSNSISVTLTGGDGTKTAYIELRDAAGNVSDQQVATCILDTVKPELSLALLDTAGNSKPNRTSIPTFQARITVANLDEGTKYKLYGDFNYNSQSATGTVESTTEWKDFKVDDGQTYMTISNLYCTSGDATKKVYVIIKDVAENEESAEASFIYDTTPPVVTVSDRDYDRLSKVHVERRSSATTLVEGKYADEINFTFSVDSKIQAYKVCAYKDQAQAEAVKDIAAQEPIETTYQSVHMHENKVSYNALTPISAKIKGADLEVALIKAYGDDYNAETGVDGLHVIVVYAQDEAGIWSVAAKF